MERLIGGQSYREPETEREVITDGEEHWQKVRACKAKDVGRKEGEDESVA